MGGFLNEKIEASFCIAQRSRTVFLCSEKEGTARGAQGRPFQCGRFCDITQIDKTNYTQQYTTHTHKRRNARRSLTMGTTYDLQKVAGRGCQGRERATRGPGRAPKNKHPPTTTTRLILAAQGAQSAFSSGAGAGWRHSRVLSEGGDEPLVGGIVSRDGATISKRPRNRRPAPPPLGRNSCGLGHQKQPQRSLLPNF